MFSPNFFPQSAIVSNRFQDLTPVLDFDDDQDNNNDPQSILQQIKEDMEFSKFAAPRLPTKEEAFIGRKKCEKCKQFYTESSPSGCYYHPGSFKTPDMRRGTMCGWSCCRLVDGSNIAAYQHDSKGCAYAAFHSEDVLYTNTILRFGYDPAAKARHEATMSKALEAAEKAAPPAKPLTPNQPLIAQYDPNQLMEIPVSTADTFAGLALRYSTSISELKRINRIQTPEEMYLKGRMYVPKKEGVFPIKPATVLTVSQQFRNQTKASPQEADYYLAQANDDLDKAIQLWKEDCHWEQTQSKPLTPTSSSSSVRESD